MVTFDVFLFFYIYLGLLRTLISFISQHVIARIFISFSFFNQSLCKDLSALPGEVRMTESDLSCTVDHVETGNIDIDITHFLPGWIAAAIFLPSVISLPLCCPVVRTFYPTSSQSPGMSAADLRPAQHCVNCTGHHIAHRLPFAPVCGLWPTQTVGPQLLSPSSSHRFPPASRGQCGKVRLCSSDSPYIPQTSEADRQNEGVA